MPQIWVDASIHPHKHALSFPKGGLVLALNDNAANEWEALGAWALIPSAITYKHKIHSMTVQGERTGAGVRYKSGKFDCGAETVG